MRRFYLGLCWVAACGSEPAAVATAIDDVEPATAVEGTPTPVLIHGRGFYVRSEVDFGNGSLDVDATFTASLGDTVLEEVARVDARTLRATVPGTLPAGAYDLEVEGPGGRRATLRSAFVVLAPPPDRLVIASAAGGGPAVGEVVLPLGASLTLHAAAYRDTRWRGDVAATWTVEGDIGSLSVSRGDATVLTATALGSGLLRARTDDGLEATTGSITVRCAQDLDCDDGDACTTDRCDPALGCVTDPVICDDADACTTDRCDETLGCVTDPVVCDDGNACTTDRCDSLVGCVTDSVVCNDGNACTKDSCDPAVGCQTEPVVCDDGSACTTDRCDTTLGCVTDPVDCDDGDACTADRCDETLGCVTDPVVCNDGNACTTDRCDSLLGCVTDPVVCNDGNACTKDSCDPAVGCQTEPVVCDDGNACTTDRCDTTLGCVTDPVDCDDGDACTADRCDSLLGCVTEPVVCNDGNACTEDNCDPAVGCQTEPVVCDDGDACTTDRCDTTLGCVTDPVVCNDGNACTTDSCDSLLGCVSDPVVCDDGDACTTDSCDPISGCKAEPVDCDDGKACNGVESCVGGGCVAGTPLDCDDGDSCTADSCDDALGCVSVPLDTAAEGPVADASCGDGVDNDCDGLTDLADPECEDMPPIPSIEVHPPASSLYDDSQSVPPPGEIVDPVSQPPAVSLVEADVSATRDDADPIDALAFSLDWGNGTVSTSTGLALPLTTGYVTAGDYSAWLRVTDTAGLAAYASFEVVVAPAGHLTSVTDGSDPGPLRTAITTTTKSAPYVVLVSDLAGAPITVALTSTLDIAVPVEIVGDGATIDCSGIPAGGDCLTISADDVWIMGFEIRGAAGHPIRVNGARARVTRCRIEDNGTGVLWAGNGGSFGPDNEVVGTLGTGPALEIRAPVSVTRNRIHSNGGDGILVAATPAGSPATIARNWIWSNLRSGIEIADAVAGTRVWLNVVDGNGGSGIAAGASSSGTDLRDNAVTNNGGAGVSAAGGQASFASFDYNAYWGNAGGVCAATPACVPGPHDRQVDPVYAGPADFRLRPASPLRDAGIDVGVDVNGPVPGFFNGAAPDIGGWETP